MYEGICIGAHDNAREEAWIFIIEQLGSTNEVWMIDSLDADNDCGLMNNRTYRTRDLIAALQKSYNVIFARLIGMQQGSVLNDPIITYDDFIRSECECIVFCIDAGYFELYSKSYSTLSQLYKAALQEPSIESVDWIKSMDRVAFTL